MISRQWHGIARRECASDYLEHLRTETLPQLHAIPGFAGASVLKRNLPEGVEFLVATRWESMSAIEAFAGSDVEAAVVPVKVRQMMMSYDERAQHYEVLY